MLVQVHAALFPNVRLLAVSEQSTRSETLTVAVTHPGTNAHNCCLTSNSDLTTIFPLNYWYSIVRYYVVAHLHEATRKKMFEKMFEIVLNMLSKSFCHHFTLHLARICALVAKIIGFVIVCK